MKSDRSKNKNQQILCFIFRKKKQKNLKNVLLPKIFFEAEFVHFGGEKFRRSKILRSPSLRIIENKHKMKNQND